MIDVVVRSEQPFLFTTETDKHDCPFRTWTLRREQACQLEHPCCSGSIIVSAMMNLAGALRQTAATATTQMVVVRANHDHLFLRDGIASFEYADHVVSRDFFANDVRYESELSGDRLFGRLRLLFCNRLPIGQS